jgi:serine/threonine protein kinase
MVRRISISGSADESEAVTQGTGAGDTDPALDSVLRKIAHVSHLSADPPLPRLGQIIGEKYRIEAQLGRGGMGVVFRATHLVSRKAVALKWMLRATTDTAAHRRLLREALAAGRIDHPNVVDVYDVGQEGVSAYLVMELLHGEALRARLDRGRLDSREAIDLLLPALRGVSAAHRAGVIHRDLKPDNIFLCTDPDGTAREAKVLDFGVSAVLAPSALDPTLTDGATILGTPAYMSPERLASAQDTDERTDVYAFGVMLYEALTGQLPFVADSYSGLVLAVAHDPPKPPSALCPDIPAGLARVILQALAKQREDRPETVDSLHDLLAPFGSAQRRADTPARGTLDRRASNDPDREAASSSRPPVLLTPDQVFASRYRVRRCIAEGGMGVTFEAEHTTTERRVALKLFPYLTSVGDAHEKFEIEAKISARVNSPYIVEVLDAGYDEASKSAFLVMELLEGQTLAERVREEGPLEAQSALRLLEQVASGLDAAHAHREPGGAFKPIVHRDLKPENLFLARQHDGSSIPKILGYGIAKVLGETGNVTQELRGTPLYMSFEQITGRALSAQTDVWALGLIAFYMLTGARYWRFGDGEPSSVQALFAEILSSPHEAPSVRLREQSSSVDLPGAFDAWMLRCIERDPLQRFASAGAAVQALQQVLVRAPRATPMPSLPPVTLGERLPAVIDAAATAPERSRPARATPKRGPASLARALLAAPVYWLAAGAAGGALSFGALLWLVTGHGEAPAGTSAAAATVVTAVREARATSSAAPPAREPAVVTRAAPSAPPGDSPPGMASEPLVRPLFAPPAVSPPPVSPSAGPLEDWAPATPPAAEPAVSEASALARGPRRQRELAPDEAELVPRPDTKRSRPGQERAARGAKARSEESGRPPKPLRQPGLAEAYKTR